MSLSSDSESDDEEYLLSSTADENREAMIRRKLYPITHLATPWNSTNPTTAATIVTITPSRNSKNTKEASVDLDSVNFSASVHTSSSLLKSSSTHALLKFTNQLSQSIRLLNSTMQTFVYENYSKFISATNAIRSIGQNADLSDGRKLNFKMTRIEEQNTVLLEDSLKQKQQQVVKKLTLKRLLHRLTGLVQLPSTLLASLQRDRKDVLLMKD
jgi:hypothetical protein